MLTVKFAFEVFPVVGEGLAQARRDVIRDFTALMEREWGCMEFRDPFLACWCTEHEYVPYAQIAALPPA
jgi:hypothetical protein